MTKNRRKKPLKPPMLITALLGDLIGKNLLPLVLVALTLGSAFGLVILSHQQRQLYAELELLNKQRNELDVEWRQLRLEQRVLAEHSRLEELATAQLGMKNLDLKSERIVKQVKDGD